MEGVDDGIDTGLPNDEPAAGEVVMVVAISGWYGWWTL